MTDTYFANEPDDHPPASMPTNLADKQFVLNWMRTGFVAFAVVMTTSAFYFLFAQPADEKSPVAETASQSPLYLLLWLVLYAISALICARDILKRGIARGALPLLAFAALAMVSIIWSLNPSRTLLYGGMLAANFIVGYALSAVMPPRQFLNALMGTLIGLFAISYGLLLLNPEIVTSTRYGGAWLFPWQYHAVFSHKSDAGYYAAALSLIVAHGVALQARPILRTLLFALTMFAILLANSATALGAALMLNALLVLANRMSQLNNALLPITACLALVFSVAAPMIDVGSLAGILARDVELTGRIPIWQAGFEFANNSPLLGYGYYAFFDLGTFSPVWELWNKFEYFRTPHFHNSALDVLISLGVLGVIGYVVLAGSAFTILTNPTIMRRERNLLAAMLILFIISAAFDFTLMKHNAFATTFLAYVLVTAQRRTT